MADERPNGPVLRPPTSVGIPLLRDEIEAVRRRRMWAILAVLAFVGVLLGVWGLASVLRGDGEADPVAAVPTEVGFVAPTDAGEARPDAWIERPPVSVERVGGRTVARARFGEASGFRTALTNASLTGAEADAVTAALQGVMDFRRCRPDHQLTIEREPDGSLHRFEYRASITQIYEVTRNAQGGLVGGQVEVPIARTTLARGGVVASSLGEALEAVDLGRTLVGAFVETFEGRINFNTETRAGDTFRIVVDEERVDGAFLRYGTIQALEYHSQRRGLLRAFYYAPRPELSDYYDETGRGMHGGWLRTPLQFDHISSPFDPNRMHPVLRRVMPHNGIDYAAASGTPVWAAGDGTVTFVGERGPNGNLVSLRHADGFESHYAHLSRFAPGIAAGQTVRQRQLIGYVGSTGRSTGPHLHFGLKHRDRWIDPARELNGPGRMLPARELSRFRGELSRLRSVLADIELPELPAAAPSPPAQPTAAPDEASD